MKASSPNKKNESELILRQINGGEALHDAGQDCLRFRVDGILERLAVCDAESAYTFFQSVVGLVVVVWNLVPIRYLFLDRVRLPGRIRHKPVECGLVITLLQKRPERISEVVSGHIRGRGVDDVDADFAAAKICYGIIRCAGSDVQYQTFTKSSAGPRPLF